MIKTMQFIGIFISIAIMGMSCSYAQTDGVAEDITVKDAYEKIQNGGDFILLDVRTDGECAQGMLPGAMQIDYYGSDFMDEVSKLDKDLPLIVYCASGGRSSEAMRKLSKAGFKEVYNVKGGYKKWNADKLPTTKG